MENKSEKSKHEIFESALLGKHESMLERLSNNPEGFLYLVSTRPVSFDNYLYTLENDLKQYFGPDCVKNQNGRFLKITEEFVSSLHKEREKLLDQSQEILERIINLILDFYSPPAKKEDKSEKKKNKLEKLSQPAIEKVEKKSLPPVSAEELFLLQQKLCSFIKSRPANQEILKQAKEVVGKYYGKLPKGSDAEEILENILNLILDYYSPPEKKENTFKKLNQPLVEKIEEKFLPPISAKELFLLNQELRLFVDGRLANQEILKQAKEVVSKYYGKLPEDSGAEKILENILNLILDYYKTKKGPVQM